MGSGKTIHCTTETESGLEKDSFKFVLNYWEVCPDGAKGRQSQTL